MTAGTADLLGRRGSAAEEIDLLVTPEADSGWMVNAISDRDAPPESWAALQPKIYNALSTVGAPGCAALPIGLDRAWTTGRIGPGQRLLLLGMETRELIDAGMLIDWTSPTPSSGS